MDDDQPGYAGTEETKTDQEAPGWQFKSEDASGQTAPEAPANSIQPIEPVSWTASEYVAHHKSTGWFVMLGLATAVAAIIVYFFTQGDRISAGMIVVVGAVFGVMAARTPRVLEYSVNSSGVQIGPKFYGYGELKSFAILEEGVIRSILLLPLKRFMTSISIYYDPADEDKIVRVLSAALPVEQRSQDPLERLMRRVRF